MSAHDSDIAAVAALMDSDSHLPTGKGEERLALIGVEVAELRRGRRRFAGPCLDWTARREHLNGALAAGLLTRSSISAGSSRAARPGPSR